MYPSASQEDALLLCLSLAEVLQLLRSRPRRAMVVLKGKIHAANIVFIDHIFDEILIKK